MSKNNPGHLNAYNILKTIFKLSVIIFILWNFFAYEFIYNEDSQLQDSTPIDPSSETTFSNGTTDTIDIGDVELDQQYCQSERCKFLFAYYPPEQETQANRHFLSFVQLAEKLNRTMILTHVGSSHIFACKAFPFEFYYNVEDLKQRFPNVNFISQNDFREWTIKRKEKPDTFHGHISNSSDIVAFDKPHVEDLNINNCLRMFDLKLNDSTIFKRVGLRDGERFDNFMEFNTDAQVLLVRHIIRHPLFDHLKPLDYADHLVNTANSISERLRPFIASHWRMEHGKPNLMPDCANNLVRWVKDTEQKFGIKNLYLATDYPLLKKGRRIQTQSTTWHKITKFHTTAIQILNSSLPLNTWVSLNSFDYLPKDTKLENELSGAGIQGILDKLVLIQADYFVSCPRLCGRVKSHFTRMIRDVRSKEIKTKSSHLKNVGDVWYGVDSGL